MTDLLRAARRVRRIVQGSQCERCPNWLSELARQGGPPVRCGLEEDHAGDHDYDLATRLRWEYER